VPPISSNNKVLRSGNQIDDLKYQTNSVICIIVRLR
jgi:hypothetical protein